MRKTATTHGILNPSEGAQHFTLTRHAPSAALSPFVERYWIVRWDLEGRPPFVQETLPHPCVNLAFEAGRSAVHGVGTAKFRARLEGKGHVIGTKFRPGGFFPFYGHDVSELTDRVVALSEVFDVDGLALEGEVLAAEDDASAIAVVERFLMKREPEPDAIVDLVARITEVALENRAITRVEQLSEQTRVPVRKLQRLFRKYVGASAKWVIRRYRVHEAAERVAHGTTQDWAALALELGYTDQSHFIADFKSQVGHSPAAYAELCRGGA
ncbi:MAG: AraC family transcriptional regulator [Myxococcales bacterium]|nr:AraC family transcriptional regulator [Myxococcales bacterium]MCB9579470.1 AraC family transcriptional regulator [Polyangiaceae bacterium]